MATAIPPRAAEVASKRPVRQKFPCSEAGGTQLDAWSMGIGSVRSGINLRKGTSDLQKKIAKMDHGATYFFKARLWWGRAKLRPERYKNRYLKSLKMHFFTKFSIFS
jgi:hypothetical protein